MPEAELEKPGPKPLEAVARERGGDAGNVAGGDKREGAAGPSAPGGDNEQESKTKGEDQGTGEKYIKTSGLAAEGGDFDAAKAGAGREADRTGDSFTILQQLGRQEFADMITTQVS